MRAERRNPILHPLRLEREPRFAKRTFLVGKLTRGGLGFACRVSDLSLIGKLTCKRWERHPLGQGEVSILAHHLSAPLSSRDTQYFRYRSFWTQTSHDTGFHRPHPAGRACTTLCNATIITQHIGYVLAKSLRTSHLAFVSPIAIAGVCLPTMPL
jgi:hypothetical protein